MNRPVGPCHVKDIVSWMSRFDGNFVLQTIFLKGQGWASEDWVSAWMDIVRVLRPREIQVYTIDRETPMKGLLKYTPDQMRALVQPLINEGFNIQIKG